MKSTRNWCPVTDYGAGLRQIQVELSTVCNALCLGCNRTDKTNFNRVKAYIPANRFLDIEVVLNLFNSEAGRRIEKIEFCGNIDEPFAHPRLEELLEKLYLLRPDLNVSIHTNGGLGSTERFTAAGRWIKKFHPQSHIRFSLDGLEDTNHIYRQGVKWNKALANLKAAIATDAKVIWQFLTMPWNEHQAEPARTLAKELGCREFWLRPDRSEATRYGLTEIQKRKKDDIRKPVRPRGIDDMTAGLVEGADREVSCSYHQWGMAFLSWEGKLWPCCFMSNVYYESEYKIKLFEDGVLGAYLSGFNDLNKFNLDEVLKSEFFRKDLMEAWSSGGKMNWRCAEKCSVGRKRTSDQKADDRTHLERVEL